MLLSPVSILSTFVVSGKMAKTTRRLGRIVSVDLLSTFSFFLTLPPSSRWIINQRQNALLGHISSSIGANNREIACGKGTIFIRRNEIQSSVYHGWRRWKTDSRGRAFRENSKIKRTRFHSSWAIGSSNFAIRMIQGM